ADQLVAAGYPVLSGPRVTGDGYYEFETLDPDQNRLEVTCLYQKEI
ncbi:MAG: glyoxalase, partial [Chitinophagaceae bacterium]